MADSLWSPHDPAYLSNPYTMYRRLREDAPVHLAQTGEYIITRYADVRYVLKSQSFRSGNRLDWFKRGIGYFQSRDEDLSHIYHAINSFVLFLNPPEHQKVRTLISKAWSNLEVEQIIRSCANDLLLDMHQSFDLVSSFSKPLPVSVICRLMSIPAKDHEHLQSLGTHMTRALDLYTSWKEIVQLNEASREFVFYFQRLVDEKRTTPDDGLASRIIAASDQDNILEDRQLVSILIFLFLAGEETTSHSITTALFNLVRQPDKYQEMRTTEDRKTAIEELFRFDSPVHLLGRVSTEQVTVGGVSIPPNSPVTLSIASANHDPGQFDHPTVLDLKRTPNPHLSFGHGTHFCLGEWLGKLQVRIAIEMFIAKFDTVYLPDQQIRWNRNLSVRGIEHLQLSTRPQ